MDSHKKYNGIHLFNVYVKMIHIRFTHNNHQHTFSVVAKEAGETANLPRFHPAYVNVSVVRARMSANECEWVRMSEQDMLLSYALQFLVAKHCGHDNKKNAIHICERISALKFILFDGLYFYLLLSFNCPVSSSSPLLFLCVCSFFRSNIYIV